MQVWMSNSQSNTVYERELFVLVCDCLIFRRGARRVSERFSSLLSLASLPLLDQPQFLEPAALISEIHEAWAELWTLSARDLFDGRCLKSAMGGSPHGLDRPSGDQPIFGQYLARPLHELTVFAASGGKDSQLRVSTHRRLIVDAQRLQAWRVIHGGTTR